MTNQIIDGARKVGATIVAYSYSEKKFWVLKHRFAHRDAPELGRTLVAVRERGSIDLRHWRIANKGEY